MSSSLHYFEFQLSLPIVGVVDQLIDRAHDSGASDIHIDPRSSDVRVRFRIDGVLHDVCALQKATHGEFVARIKILAGLRIDERIVPQDGRLTVGEHLDIRVTVIASYYGESIVMRLLKRNKTVQTLGELGFTPDDVEKIMRVLRTRQGLVLVTGPTGSGKTTTLYSLLMLVDDASVSTVTIEDPVEYAMVHARQIQVQQKRGINFANGLRSILRQDPDVIMVGEIRDRETATIATSAALTGHLVLSTLHTNDAASTVTRCVEMGVEPYLVNATLRLVVSQRLLRKLCGDCKQIVVMAEYERRVVQKYTDSRFENVFRAVGCDKCGGTGYVGRTVVAEVLLTQKTGEMKSIGYQAITKYLQGHTSFEEAIKVLQE